jgi:hypothetical protein
LLDSLLGGRACRIRVVPSEAVASDAAQAAASEAETVDVREVHGDRIDLLERDLTRLLFQTDGWIPSRARHVPALNVAMTTEPPMLANAVSSYHRRKMGEEGWRRARGSP